ncbi:uncharacterized protein LOC127266530 [Andrographis paniculata]|uniref:uncharacterized protein LOC127266530 n=1 Tax=Andrographis paniculata TaxID=175694 RepID=UPI0021E87E60|nr:uncharacterized protein LOC127266530 [Andrographis paniculata]
MVMEIVHEEIGEGSAQCANHPYRNSGSGGICALCLQEKLGKLVSSSFHTAVFPSSPSSSSSPSFRSEFGAGPQVPGLGTASKGSRRAKLPFVSGRKKKGKDGGSSDPGIVFKRSKSTATPRRGMQFLDEDYSPSRRGFWSFLYLSSSSSKRSSGRKTLNSLKKMSVNLANVGSSSGSSSGMKREELEGNGNGRSPEEAAMADRKVSRSRSVGCGSRSFSGDFFERISTGFGDCTLRRVESQREGKHLQQSKATSSNSGNDCIKERVRSCGGIFSGSYLVASSSSISGGHLRSKSNWGWAFASPMRAFGKPSSSSSSAKRVSSQNKNASPNLAAIPSLLAVGG